MFEIITANLPWLYAIAELLTDLISVRKSGKSLYLTVVINYCFV